MQEKKFFKTEHEIAYIILKYLARHPLSKDTLQGLADWWIMKEQVDYAVEQVSNALEFLVSKDLIIEKRDQYQDKYYQLNTSKAEEIRLILTGDEI